MSHWSETYVGLPYVIDEFDCTHLLQKVSEEVFGKVVPLPQERQPTVFGLSDQVARHKNHYFEPIEKKQAEDGDIVIMITNKRLNHIGVYFNKGGVDYVLHNLRNTGSVAAHKIRDLARINLQVEGYYKFREEVINESTV